MKLNRSILDWHACTILELEKRQLYTSNVTCPLFPPVWAICLLSRTLRLVLLQSINQSICRFVCTTARQSAVLACYQLLPSLPTNNVVLVSSQCTSTSLLRNIRASCMCMVHLTHSTFPVSFCSYPSVTGMKDHYLQKIKLIPLDASSNVVS
jgi:hypothetical protein